MPSRSFQRWSCRIAVQVFLILLPGTSSVTCQAGDDSDSLRQPQRVISFEHVNQELILKCNVGLLIIKAYADNIIHIRYYPSPEKKPLPMWGISGLPAAPKYRVDSTLTGIRLSTAQLNVSVDRKSAQISFSDQKQNIFLSSKQVQMKSVQVAGEDTYTLHAEFFAPEDEAYYGLGQHQNGWLNQRGQTVRLWPNSQSLEGEVISLPFLVTNRKYGLAFDNASRVTVLPGKEGVTSWDAEVADALSYFVIYGNATDDIYRGYRFLTGAAPLPPKSALGYIAGGQRSESQDQLMQIAQKYREKGYPADMLTLTAGESGLDSGRWPDPASFNAALRKLGFEIILSIRPDIQTGSPHFDTLDSMGCVAKDKEEKTGQNGSSFLIDVTKPPCASWLWNNIQETYASKGFTRWSLDGIVPDLVADTLALNAGMGARVINLYPLLQAKAVYEGHRQGLGERALILSRSGYLGAQQYGTSFGSTDAAPQWGVLKRQIAAGLNATASGLSYWFSAIGAGQTTPIPGVGNATSDFAELYVRWFEFTAFCPTFRTQGSMPAKDVWSFGGAAEKILAKYLSLRYRLLPYIYSLAHTVTETGAPLMRALFMDFPQDPEVRDIRDEYMFGPAFLVAPVVEKGQTAREVYLPKGSLWFDYWTGRRYPGGQRVNADAPLEVIPLFVRAGSIIPHGNEAPNTHADQKEVELRVYPGADARFDLYQDDGRSYEYEKGKFSLAQIRWDDATQKIMVTGDDRKLFSGSLDKWLNVIK